VAGEAGGAEGTTGRGGRKGRGKGGGGGNGGKKGRKGALPGVVLPPLPALPPLDLLPSLYGGSIEDELADIPAYYYPGYHGEGAGAADGGGGGYGLEGEYTATYHLFDGLDIVPPPPLGPLSPTTLPYFGERDRGNYRVVN
jgi:hypothetical protein